MNLLTIDTSIVPSVRLIGHVAYNQPWRHFTRTIDEYLLYVVKNGELYIREGNTDYVLRKGDMLLLEPNIEHVGFKEAVCHYYYLHFKHPKIEKITHMSVDEVPGELISKRKQALSSDLYNESGDRDSVFYLPKFYHYEDENELLSPLIDANNDFYKKYEGYKTMASLSLLKLLIKISRDYTSTKIDTAQPHFSKAFVKCRSILHYLNKEFANKITSEAIEKEFESNYDYLNRVFQKMTGYTIINYLNSLRISKAKDLLDTTPIKISEAGYLVGIDDPYYFSKLFKKYAGITPSQYIKLRSEMKK